MEGGKTREEEKGNRGRRGDNIKRGMIRDDKKGKG